MRPNHGTIRQMTRPTTRPSSGTATATSQDSPTSSRSAMMMPPTIMIGVDTSSAKPMKTTICTWVTSLVLREMSVGAPKLRDLLRREVDDGAEDVAAQVAAHAHGDPGGEVGRAHGRGDLHEADAEHERAVADDEAGVALGHALVDDLAVEAGQVERGDGADELEQHDEHDLARVGPQVAAEQSDQHAGAFRWWGRLGTRVERFDARTHAG